MGKLNIQVICNKSNQALALRWLLNKYGSTELGFLKCSNLNVCVWKFCLGWRWKIKRSQRQETSRSNAQQPFTRFTGDPTKSQFRERRSKETMDTLDMTQKVSGTQVRDMFIHLKILEDMVAIMMTFCSILYVCWNGERQRLIMTWSYLSNLMLLWNEYSCMPCLIQYS